MSYKNPEDKKAHQQRWREANPEYQKKWREDNPPSQKTMANNKEYRKQWWAANKSKMRDKRKLQAAKRHKRMRIWIDELKKCHGCQNPQCPYPKELPSYCLDFHHVKGEKLFSPGSHTKMSMPQMLCEIEKCTVLCAICHRMETYGNLDASGFKLCVCQ